MRCSRWPGNPSRGRSRSPRAESARSPTRFAS
jgi:hypothetical protein